MKTDRKTKASPRSDELKAGDSARISAGKSDGKPKQQKRRPPSARGKAASRPMPAIHDALRREHEELIESRQRMQATYERAPIGLVECSLEGKYISVNKEFCRITGYEKVELLKLSIKELIHREDYSNEMKLYRQLV